MPSNTIVAVRLHGPAADTMTKLPGHIPVQAELHGHLVISDMMPLISPINWPPDSSTLVIAVPSTVTARSAGKVGAVMLNE